jgi:hypothetical protein
MVSAYPLSTNGVNGGGWNGAGVYPPNPRDELRLCSDDANESVFPRGVERARVRESAVSPDRRRRTLFTVCVTGKVKYDDEALDVFLDELDVVCFEDVDEFVDERVNRGERGLLLSRAAAERRGEAGIVYYFLLVSSD